MGLFEDTSTPGMKWTAFGTASGASNSFTPPAGSLVLVLADAGGSTPTLSISSSPSVTWTQVANNTGASGAISIWYHYYTTSPGALTVTLTSSASFGIYQDIRVVAGAKTTLTGSASAVSSSTAFNMNATPTNLGSRLYATGIAASSNPTMTAVSGFTTQNVQNDGTTQVACASGYRVAGSLSATNIGWTSSASSSGWVGYVEVIPVPDTPRGNNSFVPLMRPALY